jgi:hypothetical protein
MEFDVPEQIESKFSLLEEKALQLSTDEAVLNLLEYGREVQGDAEKLALDTLAIELALCRALIACGGWFALALYSNKEDKRLLPHDWLELGSEGNPDVIMGCVLCQFTNYGHSVVELVMKGLDTPARALVRSTADLSYMLAVIAADRETFQAYVLDKESSPKELWYKLFSNRKISKRMAQIDAKFGLPKEWTDYMRLFREENSEFFSEAVHHSPTAIFVGAQPTIPGTDRVELAVLGGAPSASRSTLRYLATSLNYGLTMFVTSCERTEGFTHEFSHPRFWEAGIGLYRRIQPMFFTWLREGEANNRM